MPLKTFFLTVSFFIFLLSPHLFAQDYYEQSYPDKPISLGIVFSPNISWLRYGDFAVEEQSARFGYAYGLQADFAFAENYYFHTGFIINNLNAEARLPIDGQGRTALDRYQLQYAEIPIAIKLRSTQRYHRSYYGVFGFTAGLKLNAKRQRDLMYTDPALAPSERINMRGEANLLRLGLLIGGGIEWQLDHNLRLMTGLSLNNGFTQVIRSGEPRNSFVALNFGIIF